MGENALTVDSFLVIAIALSNLTTEPITLSKLIDPLELEEKEFGGRKLQVYANPEHFPISEHYWLNSLEVSHWFQGAVINPPGADRDASVDEAWSNPGDWLYNLWSLAGGGPHGYWLEDLEPGLAVERFKQVMERSGDAEARAAKTLGVDAYELAAHSTRLWGMELTSERDRRANQWEEDSGQVANPQKRGQITRELLSELKDSIEAARETAAEREAKIVQEEAEMRAADEAEKRATREGDS